ncbi:RND family efflux transporter MFP subunit [Ulvibacter sp. MAR_2010_11]|uniref:efflux RND transporter periplasmic adaptor subunit n=1 Tax=Ulvibacter sp. MAR_2010_11 TaxID=1250229 RepID=UPI000C2CCC18|nr:efflux RND transporter periplasmic adaptor subunit [Ulvibacter sp. MAR_2010_11]PKA84178.1 RND family efflux transporter MFP subunit [Ulvibacter sp. MAR_2010_11]
MKAHLPLIIIAFTLLACNENNEKAEENIKSVKYERIGFSNSNQTHRFSGIVKAEYETGLSFKVGGTLSKVDVKLGDKVKKGQLIGRIDPIDYEVQREQAVAQKKSAESQLVVARSTFSRAEKLYENNSVALSEYEQAKASLASAESQFKAANKQLEAANNQISYTRLNAPMNGVITSLMVESNELVSAGSIVAVLSSEGNPEVEVGIPESVIAKLQKGQEVTIELANDNFKGKIEKVAFASGQSSTYPVMVSITDPIGEIRPGMSAEVSFVMSKISDDQQNIIVAPIAAVGKDPQGHFVFVLQENSDSLYRVEKRKVIIGRMLDTGFEINNGLEGKELVVTAGIPFLRDSMKVKLLNK